MISYIADTRKPIFTKEQCEDIIRVGQQMQMKEGTVTQKESITNKRLSKISWLPFESMTPMYEVLQSVVNQVNKTVFGFDEVKGIEQAQYTEYDEGGYYDWHLDMNVRNIPERFKGQIRKISMTCLLNDPETDFTGGELEMLDDRKEESTIANIGQGSAIFFASFLRHRVKPVIKGNRKSLVMWFHGEPFK